MRLPKLCALLAGLVLVLNSGCYREHRVFHRRWRPAAEGCCGCAAPAAAADCQCCGAPPLPPPPFITPIPQMPFPH